MSGDPFQLIGTTIAGKYRVLRALGEGGYAVVYAAQHVLLGEPVAVKCVKAMGGEADGEARAAFLREAQVLFGLAHPGIVRLYDVGVASCAAGEIPYAVLELVVGTTLDAAIAARRRAWQPMSLAELLAIAEPVVSALAFAHARGVAHRDLKPSNVILPAPGAGGTGGPKVLDFGTARVVSASTVGTAGFTPMYAAPEQWDPGRFGPTGPRTDVFALGLLVAETATLEPPFAAEGIAQLMDAATRDAARPNLAVLRPDLPAALAALVTRATRTQPAERFADAGEMLGALRALVGSADGAPERHASSPQHQEARASPPPAPPPFAPLLTAPLLTTGAPALRPARTPAPPAPPRSPAAYVAAVAASVLVVALVAFGGVRLLRQATPGPHARAVSPPLPPPPSGASTASATASAGPPATTTPTPATSTPTAATATATATTTAANTATNTSAQLTLQSRSGVYSNQELDDFFARHQGELLGCYRDALKSDPTLQGSFKWQASLFSGWTCESDETGALHAKLCACVVRKSQDFSLSTDYERAPISGTTATYSVRYRPR